MIARTARWLAAGLPAAILLFAIDLLPLADASTPARTGGATPIIVAFGASFVVVAAFSFIATILNLLAPWIAESVWRGGRRSPTATVMAGTLMLAVPAHAFAIAVTSGPTIAAHDAIATIRIIGAAVIAHATAVLLVSTWRLAAIETSRSARHTALFIAVVLFMSATAWVDQNLYNRQYPIIHLALDITAISALVLTIGGRWPRRFTAGLAGLAVVVGIPSTVAMVREATPQSLTTTDRIAFATRQVVGRLAPELLATSPTAEVDLIAGRWGRVHAPDADREALLAGNAGRVPRHVIMITVDTLRARNCHFLGYGRETTPNLDELAKESVVFERAYSQAAHTVPSILSTFTGRYPGALNYARRQFSARSSVLEFTLAEILKSQGMATIGVCSFFADKLRGEFKPLRRGFDDFRLWEELPFLPAETVSATGRKKLERADSERLFLWLHMLEPHGPHGHIPQTFGPQKIDLYDSSIQLADQAIGEFLAFARNHGILDDALLIVHADHGEEFREHGGLYHGGTLYEEAIHVPFMIRMPGLAPRRVSEPVELVDMVATVLDVMDVEPPEPIHGDSLIPAMLGKPMNGIVFAQVPSRGELVPEKIALVEGDRKIIGYSAGQGSVTFDLATDPLEKTPDPKSIDAETTAMLRRLVMAARAVAIEVKSGASSAPAPTRIERAFDWTNPEAVRGELVCGDPDRIVHALSPAYRIGIDGFRKEMTSVARTARDRRILRSMASLAALYQDAAMNEVWLERTLKATDVERQLFLDTLASTITADDIARFADVAGTADPMARHRLSIAAARLGNAAVRRELHRALGTMPANWFLTTLNTLTSHDPIIRDVTIGMAVTAEDPSEAIGGLAILGRSRDPLTLPILAWQRSIPGRLTSEFDDTVLLQGDLPDHPAKRSFYHSLATTGGPKQRATAIERLLDGRRGAGEILDALDVEFGRPSTPWNGRSQIIPGRTLGIAGQGSRKPLSICRIRWNDASNAPAPGSITVCKISVDGREGTISGTGIVVQPGQALIAVRTLITPGAEVRIISGDDIIASGPWRP